MPRRASLAAAGVEAVSVCFLFSFLNPDHERRAATIVKEEIPDAFVSASPRDRLDVSRVRALLDDSAQRLCRPPRLAVHRPAGRGARRARPGWRAAPDAVRRRRDRSSRGEPEAREPAHVWPGRRPDRRDLGSAHGRLRLRDHARRRRNLCRHRRRPGRSRRDAPSDGHPRGRLRRDRADARPRRRSAPAEARSRASDAGGMFTVGPQSAGADPGPAGLRARRRAADDDRRQPAARTPTRRQPARRRDDARARACASSARERDRRAALDERRGGGARHGHDSQPQHDARESS